MTSQKIMKSRKVKKDEGVSSAGGTPTAVAKTPVNANAAVDQEDENDVYDDDPKVGLLNQKSLRQNRRKQQHQQQQKFDPLSSSWAVNNDPHEWQRPYWLGASLCLILFAFWLLDSLKDPLFGDLVNGNLKRHQPIAKLVSVATTLALVVFLEFVSHARRQWQHRRQNQLQHSNGSVLEEGGTWTKMSFQDDEEPAEVQNSHAESSTLAFILVSYTIILAVFVQIIGHHRKHAHVPDAFDIATSNGNDDNGFTSWHMVGYLLYATIESFGSLAVASFWSFTNTTLSLEDAAKYYGPIVAIAQLGAIGGATMVTTNHSDTSLILLACLVIVLHLVVMNLYMKRFRPTNIQAIAAIDEHVSEVVEPVLTASPINQRKSIQSIVTAAAHQDEPDSLWSGVYLILRHHYVLLLLGVSCLYEVSLTCLDYQMKLIGYNRFEKTVQETGLSFTEFMGHYGQMVNATSLFLSLIGFPWLISRLGLRYTLRLFPTLLVVATVVAFRALPGNLTVLFVSMSLCKAMTYSIHDPSKELLYLPTSNSIKFKAKFWIDIVGARVAKAVGSTINTYAGNVDRSLRIGSIPSLLSAILLWVACYMIGIDFDKLIESGMIVGLDDAGTCKTYNEGIHSGIYLDDDDNQPSGMLSDDVDYIGQDDDAVGETEDDFVSNSPEKPANESSIELQDLNSAMQSISKEPSWSRRESV